MKPLTGIRVLDFSKVLAGPLCGQWLGDLGADVIKIEPPGTGDDTRGWPPFRGGEGAVFLSANRNKRSLALGLKTPAGQAAMAGTPRSGGPPFPFPPPSVPSSRRRRGSTG